MYYCKVLLQATILLPYRTNVLCATLQVAAKVPTYYAQCYTKLHLDVARHSANILLVLIVKALHKGYGL